MFRSTGLNYLVLLAACLAVSTLKCTSGPARVLGGYRAGPGRSYFYAYVEKIQSSGAVNETYTTFCGGTYISDSFVLTAAHCVLDAGWNRTELYVIDNNFALDPVERGKGRRLKAEVVKVHLNYGMAVGHKTDDIAVLKIEKKVNKSRALGLCQPEIRHLSFYDLFIVGMGTTKPPVFPNTEYPDVLMESPMIEDAACKKFLRDEIVKLLKDGTPELITDLVRYETRNKVCVGNFRGSLCSGDNGGPLVIDDGSQMCLYGILSYGDEACTVGKISVATRVSSYLKWIAKSTSR